MSLKCTIQKQWGQQNVYTHQGAMNPTNYINTTTLHSPSFSSLPTHTYTHLMAHSCTDTDNINIHKFFINPTHPPTSQYRYVHAPTPTHLLEAGWRQLKVFREREREKVSLELWLQGRQFEHVTQRKGEITQSMYGLSWFLWTPSSLVWPL